MQLDGKCAFSDPNKMQILCIVQRQICGFVEFKLPVHLSYFQIFSHNLRVVLKVPFLNCFMVPIFWTKMAILFGSAHQNQYIAILSFRKYKFWQLHCGICIFTNSLLLGVLNTQIGITESAESVFLTHWILKWSWNSRNKFQVAWVL